MATEKELPGANPYLLGAAAALRSRPIFFHLQTSARAVTSIVTTFDELAQTMTQTVSERQIIDIGNVGTPGKATYKLYSPYTNAVSFRTVRYGT